MITAIHQSHLSMALRCGEQFRRRYILGEIIPPSIAAARGTAVHKASEINLKQKITTKKDLPLSDMQDAARDAFVSNLKDGVFLPKSEHAEKKKHLNEGLNQSIRLTRLYAEEVAPEIQPLEVEREFEFDLGLDLPIAGRIDLEQHGKVDDLKTTNRKWPDKKIDSDIQPVFYSLAHKRMFNDIPQFRYHILIAQKSGEVLQTQNRICTPHDFVKLEWYLHAFLDGMRAGVFLPAEIGSWVCTEKWCGYFTTCPYVGNGHQTRWV